MNRFQIKDLEAMSPFSASAYWVIPGLKPHILIEDDNKHKVIKKEIWNFIKFHWQLSQIQLIVRSRKRHLVIKRQLVQKYLVQKGFTLKETGQLTGGYDHSTVINSIKAVDNLIHTDEQFAKEAARFVRQFDLWVC